MDKIIISNLRAHGIIGVYEHERITPQSMLINITLYTDTRNAAQSDDLADCINYDELSKMVRQHAETAQRLTVEALAEDIAKLCLKEAGAKEVRIRVEKPDALDYVDQVGVEIKRP